MRAPAQPAEPVARPGARLEPVADSSIVVGIFGVIGLLWLEERRGKK